MEFEELSALKAIDTPKSTETTLQELLELFKKAETTQVIASDPDLVKKIATLEQKIDSLTQLVSTLEANYFARWQQMVDEESTMPTDRSRKNFGTFFENK
jgi:phage shock protein A